MRVCRCGKHETPEEPFYTKSAVCRDCYNKKKSLRKKEYSKTTVGQSVRRRKDINYRSNPKYRSAMIVKDSRRADKLFGRENNLTREVVETLISDGCYYCGETKLKMTLDRRDNSIGHLTSNVVPCCIRCNYIRRDMPFEAWVAVVPGIIKAKDLGLFGDWTCSIHNRYGR